MPVPKKSQGDAAIDRSCGERTHRPRQVESACERLMGLVVPALNNATRLLDPNGLSSKTHNLPALVGAVASGGPYWLCGCASLCCLCTLPFLVQGPVHRCLRTPPFLDIRISTAALTGLSVLAPWTRDPSLLPAQLQPIVQPAGAQNQHQLGAGRCPTTQAECQHQFPAMVRSTRPWMMCLDAVPYI